MYPLIDINALLYMSFITLGSFTTAAPLYSNTIAIVGGGPLNSGVLTVISTGAIKELQLAHFFENLEASFFNTSLMEIIKWGINKYPNNTIDIVNKITTISILPL